MQMMNRAIEDANDFGEMLKKLKESVPVKVKESAAQRQPKRPDENREQHRARINGTLTLKGGV